MQLIKKISTHLTILTISLFFAGLVLAPVGFAQTPKDSVCDGIELTGGGCDLSNGDTTTINDTITQAINILSVLVGVTAVVMIIIGGFKYITSSGDSGNTASAKNTILFALIGLVIVGLAQVIVQFVINRTPDPTTSAPKSSAPGTLPGGSGGSTGGTRTGP